MTVDPTHIDDLEHDTCISALGDDPDHCHTCATVFDARRRQAACHHPSEMVEETELHAHGRGVVTVYRHCGMCGKPLEGDR